MVRGKWLMIGVLVLSFMNSTSVFAAYNSQGSAPGRTDTLNENDYSTNNWDRFTYNYEFDTGPDTKETFGVPTYTDTPAYNPDAVNIRRNKDAAHTPPKYGVFSGDIPTEQSSPYHDNTPSDYASNITYGGSAANNYYGPDTSVAELYQDTGVLQSTSLMAETSYAAPVNNISISTRTNTYSDYLYTEPTYYEDGSIGTIYIPKLSLTAKVFEGETLDSMKKGVGHFEHTSVWSGNVGIAGHNRGSSAYLSGIWNLNYGDEVTYTTKYGQRVYEVYSIVKISDDDYSYLSSTRDNVLTMITCVANESAYRWCVQAREK